MDYQNVWPQYHQELIYKNCSSLTVAKYRRDLMKLFDYARKTGVNMPSIRCFTTDLLQAYLEFLIMERRLAPVTIKNTCNSLNAFFSYLIKTGALMHNPLKGIPTPKEIIKRPKVLTKVQCYKVMNTAFMVGRSNFENMRNRAIIGLMILAGLKIREVASLKVVDLYLEESLVRVTKHHAERWVPLTTSLTYFLREYMKIRRSSDKKYSRYLWN